MFLNSCFVELIVYLIKILTSSGQLWWSTAVCADCLSAHLPRCAVLPQSRDGLLYFRGLRSDRVHRRLHFLHAGRLEHRLYTASHSLTAAANIVLIELADVSFFFFLSRTRGRSAALLHGEVGRHP